MIAISAYRSVSPGFEKGVCFLPRNLYFHFIQHNNSNTESSKLFLRFVIDGGKTMGTAVRQWLFLYLYLLHKYDKYYVHTVLWLELDRDNIVL